MHSLVTLAAKLLHTEQSSCQPALFFVLQSKIIPQEYVDISVFPRAGRNFNLMIILGVFLHTRMLSQTGCGKLQMSF